MLMENICIIRIMFCILIFVIVGTGVYRMQVKGYRNIKSKLEKFSDNKVLYNEYAVLLKKERVSSICFALSLPLLALFFIFRLLSL